MGIDKVIINSISAIIIVFLLVGCVELIIPISKKLDFNVSSRKALMQVEAKGGLTENESVEIEEELQSIGLTDVEIIAPRVGDIKYGQQAVVIVKAKYKHRLLMGLFGFTTNEQDFEYNRSVICRKVQNI